MSEAEALVLHGHVSPPHVLSGVGHDVPEELEIEADRDQLRRVLANLGRNAFQAGASSVTVTAERTEELVRIRLSDDGPGLPKRAREHLFTPFAGTVRPGGTGLGLAIAREIMVAHRGDLRLAESGDAGTAFDLEMPAS